MLSSIIYIKKMSLWYMKTFYINLSVGTSMRIHSKSMSTWNSYDTLRVFLFAQNLCLLRFNNRCTNFIVFKRSGALPLPKYVLLIVLPTFVLSFFILPIFHKHFKKHFKILKYSFNFSCTAPTNWSKRNEFGFQKKKLFLLHI